MFAKLKTDLTFFKNTYSTKFLLYLVVTQLFLKGCLFYGLFNNIIFPLLTWLNVSPYYSQLYYNLMYIPWMLKPVIGVLINTVTVYYYEKRFWQVVTAILSAFTIFMFIVNDYNIVMLTISFFLMNIVIVTLDLISESVYSRIIVSTSSGSGIVCYVNILQQIGTFIMIMFVGILADNNLYYIFFVIIILLLLLSIYPNTVDWIGSTVVTNKRFHVDKNILTENVGYIIVPVYMLIFAVWYIIITNVQISSLIVLLLIFVPVVVLIGLIYKYFPCVIANMLLYIIIYYSLSLQFNAQLQYYFTNSNVQNGYQLSYTFYVTVLDIILSVCAIFGALTYKKFWSECSFRETVMITNILTVLPCLITGLLIHFKDFSIPVVWLISIIWAVLYGTFSIQSFICVSTIFCKMCGKNYETVSIAIFYGIFNMSVLISTWLSDQYYAFYINYISNEILFEHFDIYYIILAVAVPIVLTFLLSKLVSGKCEADILVEEQVSEQEMVPVV